MSAKAAKDGAANLVAACGVTDEPLAQVLAAYMEQVFSLNYTDAPDYAKLRKLLASRT